VGSSFATVEGPLLLALIGRRYDLRLAQDEVQPKLMVTLRPKGGIRMTVEPRDAPVGSAA
jgi:cytochrome P450